MIQLPFRLLALSLASSIAIPAFAMSGADDACIDHLRQVGGPDGQSGTILSSRFSEAGTLVMLQDAGGTVWRCVAYSDGSIGEMTVTEAADDGQGAIAGAEAGGTRTERVRFAAGTSGAELTGSVAPGGSVQYQLGARDGQFLYVRVAPRSGSLGYTIRNPDGSVLLDMMSSDQEYRGQLWQSGDHVIEVVNRGGSGAEYHVIFGIE